MEKWWIRWPVRTSITALLLCIVYILSYAPVVRWQYHHRGGNYSLAELRRMRLATSAVDDKDLTFYRPVDWLIDQTPLEGPLNWWGWRVWRVDVTHRMRIYEFKRPGEYKEETSLSARVSSHSYDRATGILRVALEYRNPGDDPVYLVADRSGFPLLLASGEELSIEYQGDVLLVDVAHPRISERSYYATEMSTYVRPSTTLILPHRSLTVDYSLSLPLEQNSLFSEERRRAYSLRTHASCSQVWMGDR